jgi:hypothetical protein
VLMTIISTNLSAKSTFDVEVEIAPITSIKEASATIFTSSITIILFLIWRLENEGVIWVQAVLYFAGELYA